jgi:hypothetical protein
MKQSKKKESKFNNWESKPEYKPNYFKGLQQGIENKGLELKKTIKVNGK